MALPAGTRLGVFEVISPLGAGGMGEVYRARDTQLKRDVALKVIPSAVASDKERLDRFQREAELLAAMNHPHIAQIYGMADADGVRALVMELAEGATLAERIAAGPMPIADTLPMALQIADALEYAHERGVIHRDLKPANIKITPDGAIKVLDFGLAKALAGGEVAGREFSSAVTNSPTITSPAMTQAGLIMGTAAYMSPEQARGQTVDRRADIWAFGCVLFEMLSGRRAFDAPSVTDTIATVVLKEPDWKALPADTPSRVGELVRRCLHKDARQRLRDIGDARLEIETARLVPDTSNRPAADSIGEGRSGRTLSWIASALAIALAATGWLYLQKPSGPGTPPQALKLSIPAPVGSYIATVEMPLLAISRDGRRIAYFTDDGLRLRSLDSFDDRLVPQSRGGMGAFFSPDGHTVGLSRADGLFKVQFDGGAPVRIAQEVPYHATWGDDGRIYYTADVGASGLFAIPENGGAPAKLAAPSAVRSEAFFFSPEVLPDGTVLFTATGPGGGFADARLLAFHPARDKEPRLILQGASRGRYVAPDALLFIESTGQIVTRAFDPATLAISGSARVVATDIRVTNFGAVAHVAVSREGTLAYIPGQEFDNFVIVERDVKGALIREWHRGFPGWPEMSPDGKTLAFSEWNGRDCQVDVLSLEPGASPQRITLANAEHEGSLWSADGRNLLVSRQVLGGQREVAIHPAATQSGGTTAFMRDGHIHVLDWSPDGRRVVYQHLLSGKSTLFMATLDTPPTHQLLSEGGQRADISADGRWLAYCVQEPEGFRIRVVSFPDLRQGSQVPGNGCELKISADGSEVYFIGADALFSRGPLRMSRRSGPAAAWSTPLTLFVADRGDVFAIRQSPLRFILVESDPSKLAHEIRVISGWRPASR